MAVDTIRAISGENCDDDEFKQLTKWQLTSLSDGRVRAMLSSAQSKGPIPAGVEDFDRDPFLLNLNNGTYELKTGIFRDHSPGDLISRVAPVSYDPEATCPNWLTFLRRVLAEDPDLLAFLQRAVGYSLSGATSEECLFILHGSGANGKSTFVDTIAALLGDYAIQTPTETLMMRRSDAPTNDLARLRGARFVASAETEEDQKLAESRMKVMTGGDPIVARFLHREFFEFVPEFKVWMSCNHKPVVRGTDHAIWRRIRLIPFEVQIPREEQDPSLKGPAGKLQSELQGILNWALGGYQEWTDRGLDPPTRVVDATDAYRTDMDSLASFISDRCIEKSQCRANTGTLYDQYRTWCEETGESVMTKTALGRKLTERGYKNGKARGKRIWLGIGLLAEQASPLSASRT